MRLHSRREFYGLAAGLAASLSFTPKSEAAKEVLFPAMARRLRVSRERVWLTIEQAAMACRMSPIIWHNAECGFDELPSDCSEYFEDLLGVNEGWLRDGAANYAERLRDARERAGLTIDDICLVR